MVENNNFGIASFVCGLIGLLMIWIPFLGFILDILAIVFYAKQKKIKESGLATAGFVLGILGVIIGGIMFLFTLLGFFSAII